MMQRDNFFIAMTGPLRDVILDSGFFLNSPVRLVTGGRLA